MLEVVDLFCGVGGLSLGLRQAGLAVRAGLDASEKCIRAYRRNLHGAEGVVADVRDLSPKDLLKYVRTQKNLVLAGCPPCRLFSALHQSRKPLGAEFRAYLRLIWTLRPKYVVFENVPRIVDRREAWHELTSRLRRRGYHVSSRVVTTDHLGLPQKRTRMVLLAARDPIEIPELPRLPVRTVRDAIGHLPESDSTIPNHITMKLSPANLERLRRTPKDGGRSKARELAFDESYGRMHWDRPAPTITTRCVSFSNGCFGHPEYDRAITVREAAHLQGFPADVSFDDGVWEAARQVGNAVPPPLAKWLGGVILEHHNRRTNGT